MVPPQPPPRPLQSRLLTPQPRTRHRLPARLPPGYSGAIRQPARGCGGRAAGSGLPRPASVPAGSHGARAPSVFVHAHQPLQQPMPGRSRAAFQNGRGTPLRSRLPTYLPRASPASCPTSASRCRAVQGPNSKQACAGDLGLRLRSPPRPQADIINPISPPIGRMRSGGAGRFPSNGMLLQLFFLSLSFSVSASATVAATAKVGVAVGFPGPQGSRDSIRTLSYQSVGQSVCPTDAQTRPAWDRAH